MRTFIQENFHADELAEFLENAKAFEEDIEQLVGTVPVYNKLFHETWSGIVVIVQILEELTADK